MSDAVTPRPVPVAEIVRLQAREDKVRIFGFYGFGEQARGPQGVPCLDALFLNVQRAVRALGEGFADGTRGALRPGA